MFVGRLGAEFGLACYNKWQLECENVKCIRIALLQRLSSDDGKRDFVRYNRLIHIGEAILCAINGGNAPMTLMCLVMDELMSSCSKKT